MSTRSKNGQQTGPSRRTQKDAPSTTNDNAELVEELDRIQRDLDCMTGDSEPVTPRSASIDALAEADTLEEQIQRRAATTHADEARSERLRLATLEARRSGGWVPLPRAIVGWAVFKQGPWAVMLFIWLYVRARWKPGTVITMSGKRLWLGTGQVLIGNDRVERELSSPRYRWTRQTYRTALRRLESTREIALKSTKEGTIATVCRLADQELKSEDDGEVPNHEANLGANPVSPAAPTMDRTTKKKGGEGTGKKEKRRSQRRCVPGDDTPPRELVSGAWEAATGGLILWSAARTRQLHQRLEHYPVQQILAAIAKYGEIRKIEKPYPNRESCTWTFEDFFTPQILDKVLQQNLEYFTVRPEKKGSRNDSYLQASTPLRAYNTPRRRAI